MVKLFLVEDEIVMRDGIKKHIDWEKENIEFVGEAGDGELAYPMILEKKPDILITDIKMPFMGGLELSELVKRELPNIRIIILSGYDDFSYAQKAVSLGVTEYLLKPIAPAKLLESIRSLRDKIEADKENDSDWSMEEKLEKAEVAKQKFFATLVMGSRPVSECIEEGKELGMNLAARSFRLILLYFGVKGEASYAFSETRNAFYKKLMDWLDTEGDCYGFDRGEDGFALLVTFRHGSGDKDYANAVTEHLIEIVKSMENATYFIGIGRAVERLGEIGRAYNSAKKALSHRFFMGVNEVIWSENASVHPSAQMNLNINEIVANSNSRAVLHDFLRTGTSEEIVPVLDEIFSSIGEKNLKSHMFLNYVTMDVYFEMVRFLNELGFDVGKVDERCGNINTIIHEINSPEKAKQYLVRYMQEVIALRDTTSAKKYSKMLRTVVGYINEHYSDSELSLNTAAAMANLSPNHFSTIFSNEMGVTFIEYLINKRMEKAKELLMTTDLRSSEITYMVGYKDPHYFSHTFKKTVGMTTKEFRARRKNGES